MSAYAPPASPQLPRHVSEAEYWRNYYVSPDDKAYEWNNGLLEEKPVSDYQTYLIYNWFRMLLDAFLQTRPVAASVGLEMGFRMDLPDKRAVVRKPDLGVVLHTNPVPLLPRERSYQGIFDLCVEALSDSDKAERERDTVVKKFEYAAGGVREYFILHHGPERGFFHPGRSGMYVPIIPQSGVIHSRVLEGFRFRIRDLDRRPALAEMIEDEVYRDFVQPEWSRERVQLQQEAALRCKAEQRAARLAAKLRELGVEPD